ncbi:hypothetical protein CMK22_17970 [Candidatus Poribacteria bacterium]|nr:hypothetical protein [Candidatus Poribacteria bacterium]
MEIENRLKEIGIELPSPVKPVANYVTTVQTGNLVFTSGHGPVNVSGDLQTGQLGADMTVEEGYQSARLVGLGLISTLKDALGDLDRIKRVVKVVGFVNSTPAFLDHPKVINGVSDLLVEVFGDKGRHARSAVGMVQLPGGIPVEVEVIVEVED